MYFFSIQFQIKLLVIAGSHVLIDIGSTQLVRINETFEISIRSF